MRAHTHTHTYTHIHTYTHVHVHVLGWHLRAFLPTYTTHIQTHTHNGYGYNGYNGG